MNTYFVYWHVYDNPETYPHNDWMRVNASTRKEAEYKAWERIRSEFDYDESYVEITEIDIER